MTPEQLWAKEKLEQLLEDLPTNELYAWMKAQAENMRDAYTASYDSCKDLHHLGNIQGNKNAFNFVINLEDVFRRAINEIDTSRRAVEDDSKPASDIP